MDRRSSTKAPRPAAQVRPALDGKVDDTGVASASSAIRMPRVSRPRRKSRVPSIGSRSSNRPRLPRPVRLPRPGASSETRPSARPRCGLGRAVGRGDGRVVGLSSATTPRTRVLERDPARADRDAAGRFQLSFPAHPCILPGRFLEQATKLLPIVSAPGRREAGFAGRAGRPRTSSQRLLQAAAIAGEASVGADHPVAGDDLARDYCRSPCRQRIGTPRSPAIIEYSVVPTGSGAGPSIRAAERSAAGVGRDRREPRGRP